MMARSAIGTESQRRKEAIGAQRRKTMAEESKKHMGAVKGAQNLAEFKEALVLKYGNMMRAWRIALDSDANGTIGFIEFSQVVREEGYLGDIRKLWKELDADDSGLISVYELAPEAQDALGKFRDALKAKYGTCLEAWYKLLDTDRSGKISEDEFQAAVEELQVPEVGMKVFRWIDIDNSKTLSMEEYLRELDLNEYKARVKVERGAVARGLDSVQLGGAFR